MNHADLVMIVLGLHGSILAGALAAWFKFGDRTEVFNRSLQGTESLLKRIRTVFSVELKDGLDAIFENAGSVPSPLLSPSGNTYMERAVNPAGSEHCREILSDFAEANIGIIADYRVASQAKTNWCKWAKRLSWVLLFLGVYQGVSAIALLFDCMHALRIPDSFLRWSFAPSGLLFVLAAVSAGLCLWHHDRICELRAIYDSP